MQTLTTFRQENADLLRMLGIAAVAAAAGGIGGVVLYKAVLATKGTALAQAARLLAAPPTLGPGIQGVTLSGKATAWWNFVARGMPLAVGAAGGAIVTAGVMKRRSQTIENWLSEQMSQTEVAQTKAARLQGELTRAEAELRALRAQLDDQATSRSSSPDALTKIQGIGPVFSQRLNAAGIYTFAELAVQTPDALRDMIGTTRGATMADPAAWIVEAKKLADSS
ncbi:hypothetical protein C2W62_21600 [Candidatus Entotheonella serta]|nr:hypothetical protein C2W62_21600 [Candidatus Entotheonella serta]